MSNRETFTRKGEEHLTNVILWCQYNPDKLQDTSLSTLAKQISQEIGTSMTATKQMLSKMIRLNIIYTRGRNRLHTDFRINYLNKLILNEAKQAMSKEDKDIVSRSIDRLSKDITLALNDKGELVKDGEIVEKPFDFKDIEEEYVIEKTNTGEVVNTEETQEIQPKIESKITTEGKTISITINLTIN